MSRKPTMPTRRISRHPTLAARLRMAADYLDGLSFAEIEQRHGIKQQSIRTISRRLGCPPRNPGLSNARRISWKRKRDLADMPHARGAYRCDQQDAPQPTDGD